VSLNPNVLLAIALLPLAAAIVAGLFGKYVGRTGAHLVTIAAVAASCGLSIYVLKLVLDGAPVFNETVYAWLVSDGIKMEVGFLVDRLTALMMVVVTFVSLCVHVYTIGYMHDDPGYQRFFSYISLFTFSMLMLVMANNFMQLFFGWEAVGVVSYLLIGFWYTRPTAIFANLKAFLVNRVGDFGFALGIAGVVYFTNSLSYADAFAAAPKLAEATIPLTATTAVPAITFICIGLFIGAMGKSAQVPLHVWLPDSMEGPTPISALIHAATMVTAGIFMVARMSPLFEYSEAALVFVLVIGATTAFFMGLLGVVNNDIKRVVAYSTLSQLGYMTVALGVSAYSAAIFHLMTHAFFKALLFLGAGSVIIALHHEQDMRRMGGLRKYMPITFITMWIGTLALVGTPFFSGFYSKDTIIEAAAHNAHEAHNWVATYGYWAVLAGVFVTSFYSFRLLYMTFHGKERFRDAHDDHGHAHEAHDDHGHHGVHEPHESPWVVTLPLVLLAIPSIAIGFLTIGPMLFGTDWSGHHEQLPFFLGAIDVSGARDVMGALKKEFHGPVAFALHGFQAPAFWLAFAGFAVASVMYLWKTDLPAKAARVFALPIRVLQNKYGFDDLWIGGFAGGGLQLGKASRAVDDHVIDGAMVNGSARLVDLFASVLRRTQSGYLYHYAFAMILGLIALLAVLIQFWR
jgi:NADH-quinone oxidoreductase subunit L